MERVWLAADRLLPPFAIQLVLEGGAPLTLDDLRDASARACSVWPGMSARLQGVLGWTRWVPGAPPEVRAVDGAGWAGVGPTGADFLEAPLDPRAAPIQILLVEGAPTRVVIRCLHAVTDGRGALGFASDLLRALDRRPMVGGVGGPQTELDLALGAAPGARASPDPPRDAAAPTGAWDADAPPGRTWARVTAEAGSRAVLPRLIRALWLGSRAWVDRPLRLDVPVDLRRLQPGLRSSANLSGLLRLSLTTEPEPEALRAEIRGAVEAGDALGPVLAAGGTRRLPLWLMAAAGRHGALESARTGRYPTSATVSNLGWVSLECERWPVSRAWIVPPAAPGLPLLMTAVGGPLGLEICASAPAAMASGGRLVALLQRIAASMEGEDREGGDRME